MSDHETRARILDKAREHFLQFGFSTVTMSDIATDLGISKKTVYAHFPSKEELASEMVQTMQAETSATINALVDDQSLGFIDKLRNILDVTATHHSRLTPHFKLDLQRHAPHACQCTDDYQKQQVDSVIGRVIRQGIAEGVFRNDVDEPIVTAMFTAAFQSLLRPDSPVHHGHSVPQILDALSTILFQGILSDEGRASFAGRISTGRPTPIAHAGETN